MAATCFGWGKVMSGKSALLLVVLFALNWATSALAEEAEWRAWPLGQRLSVGISAYRPRLDTKINLDAGPIQGAIDFETNLGLEDTKSVPVLDLRWRFFKRHTFRIDYFKLDRSGFGNVPVGVNICIDPDPCIPIDPEWDVNAYVDVEVLNFGYDYSIIFNEKMNWSLGLGLSAQDFAVGLLTEDPDFPDVPIEGQSEFTAPLPSLATTFNYAFTDKWILDLALNWLEIDIDLDSSGKFDGRLLGFDAGIRWQTFKNVGFALKYTSFDLDMEIDDGDEIGGKINYKYRGPRLGVNVYF